MVGEAAEKRNTTTRITARTKLTFEPFILSPSKNWFDDADF